MNTDKAGINMPCLATLSLTPSGVIWDFVAHVVRNRPGISGPDLFDAVADMLRMFLARCQGVSDDLSAQLRAKMTDTKASPKHSAVRWQEKLGQDLDMAIAALVAQGEILEANASIFYPSPFARY